MYTKPREVNVTVNYFVVIVIIRSKNPESVS